MRKLTARVPKNFLSWAVLTGGFTLIAVGFGIIFGLGVGLIVAGVLVTVHHTVAKS
jgi:multisubunit Na+/H+ antiporter MnhE subunit